MYYDAHLHTKDASFLDVMKEQRVAGIANAATKKEYALLKLLQRQYADLAISAGIHPWKADQSSWEEMREVLEEVSIIGEIGLDNVWCNTDLNLQKAFFDKQLRYASQLQKPVILHLKGMEEIGYQHVRQYPNTYLVHWHSSMHMIQEFIDLDCYFTIGPSIPQDEAVRLVAKLVPLERLLIETDGMEALAWCEHHDVQTAAYRSYLLRSIQQIAEIKGITIKEAETAIEENYYRFLNAEAKEAKKALTYPLFIR